MSTTRVRLLAALVVGLLGPNLLSWAGQDPSLVAHYTFEEGPGGTVRDWSGNGNHGEIRGAEHVVLPDNKGVVLRFGTADAHVVCGQGPSLDLTDALTLELWMYPETGIKKGEAGLVGKGLGSYTLGYGATYWFYVKNADTRIDCSGGQLPVGEWTHVVGTFDGRYSKTYWNGKLHNVTEAQREKKKLESGGNFYLRYPCI